MRYAIDKEGVRRQASAMRRMEQRGKGTHTGSTTCQWHFPGSPRRAQGPHGCARSHLIFRRLHSAPSGKSPFVSYEYMERRGSRV